MDIISLQWLPLLLLPELFSKMSCSILDNILKIMYVLLSKAYNLEGQLLCICIVLYSFMGTENYEHLSNF